MGYMMVMGPCVNCGFVFMFNPEHVPSIRINGEREALCRSCVEAANELRLDSGLQAIWIHPDAYAPEERA